MLLAQALAEYGAMATLAESVNTGMIQLEESASEWGMEGLLILITAAVIWKIMTAVR